MPAPARPEMLNRHHENVSAARSQCAQSSHPGALPPQPPSRSEEQERGVQPSTKPLLRAFRERGGTASVPGSALVLCDP